MGHQKYGRRNKKNRTKQAKRIKDPHGLKNNCFSLARDFPDDKRLGEWKKQRETRGFDETELWNLSGTISRFVLPRLEAFLVETKKEGVDVFVRSGSGTWIEILEKMVEGHRLHATHYDWCYKEGHEEKEKKEEEGLRLFGEYYDYLWY